MDALMKRKMKEEWAGTLTLLEDLSDEKRMHFALLLSKLAKCYVEDSGYKAVLLVDDDDHLMTISVDRKSTRLNSSHMSESRMPSSA